MRRVRNAVLITIAVLVLLTMPTCVTSPYSPDMDVEPVQAGHPI